MLILPLKITKLYNREVGFCIPKVTSKLFERGFCIPKATSKLFEQGFGIPKVTSKLFEQGFCIPKATSKLFEQGFAKQKPPEIMVLKGKNKGQSIKNTLQFIINH